MRFLVETQPEAKGRALRTEAIASSGKHRKQATNFTGNRY